jgi:PAS domain S-box-containing protein
VARDIRSGEAVIGFGDDLRIVSWNRAVEELTGIRAADALGRPCWQVLGAVDPDGNTVCHAGCSAARLAKDGWPVAPARLQIKLGGGERRDVEVSTVAIRDAVPPLYLHLVRAANSVEAADADSNDRVSSLSQRQLEVLRLMAGGHAAKVVAARLGISEATVRNHIRAILRELGCHSQLQAVAEARRRRMVA